MGADMSDFLDSDTFVNRMVNPYKWYGNMEQSVQNGFEQGGVLGALNGIVASNPADFVNLVGYAGYGDKGTNILMDVYDPLNLLPGGYMDNKAIEEANKQAQKEKKAQEEALANANVFNSSQTIRSRSKTNTGIGNYIYGGLDNYRNQKSLLGV